jgi:hypothetical protein
MMDERVEHEYCTVLRTIAEKHGARAEFGFEPNNRTEEGMFAVFVTLHLTYRLKRFRLAMYVAIALAPVCMFTTDCALVHDIHMLLWQWTGIALDRWISKNMHRAGARQEKIYDEFHREWRRRHPTHIQL